VHNNSLKKVFKNKTVKPHEKRLYSFHQDYFSPIAFILSGQTEMLTRLKILPFSPVRRRVETFFALEGMDEKETKAYIENHF